MTNYIGQQLGNYRLVAELGGGGSAKVYRAEHCHLTGKEVAIKVLHASKLTQESQKQFRQEAEILQRLYHRNIIRLLDFGFESEPGSTDSIPYLVMPLAHKGSLERCYPRGQRMPLDKLVCYLEQIADALQYVHDQKNARGESILHLDIKPANMLIGDNDEIWLSDFGIAVADHLTRKFTGPIALSAGGSGMIWGSPEYMAPERFNGEDRRASDQYSLAIVVYEWLTGSPPFLYNGQVAAIIHLHQQVPPPPVRTHFPDIPSQVEAIVMKALSKKPEQRYPSVKEFAQQVLQAVKDWQQQEQQKLRQRQQQIFQQRLQQGQQQELQQWQPQMSQQVQQLVAIKASQAPQNFHQSTTIATSFRSRGPVSQPANTFTANEVGVLFDFIPPSLRYWLRGNEDFGTLPEFRYFRFWSYTLIIICCLLQLICASPFWYLEIGGAIISWWCFRRFLRRVDRLAAQIVGLAVCFYYGLTTVLVVEKLHVHSLFTWLPPGLLLGLVVVSLSAFLHYRYLVKRLP